MVTSKKSVPEPVPERAKRRNQQAPRVVGEVYTHLTIGDRIDFRREQFGFTQTELAQKIGVTQNAVSQLINDATRKPSGATLLALARELNCSPDWILTGLGDPDAVAPAVAVDERELLRRYRGADAAGKDKIMAAARAVTPK